MKDITWLPKVNSSTQLIDPTNLQWREHVCNEPLSSVVPDKPDGAKLPKGPTIRLLSGGGGGGVVILKKISCKCICIRKKFLHKTIVPKKIHARTVGWKKNSGKMFSELTH